MQSTETQSKVRAALVSAIYKKSFVLSGKAKRDYSVSEIVNLLAIDAQRLQDVFPQYHMLWSAPLQIIGIIV
jgi:ATP-binding cassette subfamily C (CFTR/MRP) protein 1